MWRLGSIMRSVTLEPLLYHYIADMLGSAVLVLLLSTLCVVRTCRFVRILYTIRTNVRILYTIRTNVRDCSCLLFDAKLFDCCCLYE